MTTTYPHLLDRFQRVLVLAGAAVVCYVVAVLTLTTGMLNFAQVRGAGAGSGARVSARRPDGLTPTACGRRRAAGSPR